MVQFPFDDRFVLPLQKDIDIHAVIGINEAVQPSCYYDTVIPILRNIQEGIIQPIAHDISAVSI